MTDKTPKKMGRPSMFTEDLGDAICARITAGESLRSICMDDAMPETVTVFRWLRQHADFCSNYTRAREEQADTLADEIVSIADERDGKAIMADGAEVAVVFDSTAVARNKLRVEARKWVAAKLKPRKYGERVQVANDPDNPMPTPTVTVTLVKPE